MTTDTVQADPGITVPATRKRRKRSSEAGRGARLLYRLIASAVAIGLWQVVVSAGLVSSAAVASPFDIAKAAGPLLGTSDFGSAALDTLTSWAEGLVVSLAIAIPVGLLLGTSDLAYRMSRFTIDFLRTIPPVALIPLSLLLYGATPKMAFGLIVFGSVWPLLLQTMYGVHQIDPAARNVAQAYRFRRRERVLYLILPSSAPFIATGVRLAATISLLLAIGAELIGGAPGIGTQISLQQGSGDIPKMWVYVVVSAVFGVALNLALISLERRVLKWHPAQRSVVTP